MRTTVVAQIRHRLADIAAGCSAFSANQNSKLPRVYMRPLPTVDTVPACVILLDGMAIEERSVMRGTDLRSVDFSIDIADIEHDQLPNVDRVTGYLADKLDSYLGELEAAIAADFDSGQLRDLLFDYTLESVVMTVEAEDSTTPVGHYETTWRFQYFANRADPYLAVSSS